MINNDLKDIELRVDRRNLLKKSFLGIILGLGFLNISKRTFGQTPAGKIKDTFNLNGVKSLIKKSLHEVKDETPDIKVKEYNRLVEEILKSPSITKNQEPKDGDIDFKVTEFNRIEKDIKFNPQFVIPSGKDFYKNHVEVLIDQASNLLERGIKTRSEWDDLNIKSFYAEWELNKFLDLDKVHKRETSSGYYNQQVNDKIAELNIEKLQKEKLLNSNNIFKEYFKNVLNEQSREHVIASRGRLAYMENNTSIDKNDIQNESIVLEQAQQATQYINSILQGETLETSKEQSNLRYTNILSKKNWELVNRLFRIQRTEIERKYEYQKLRSHLAEDGVLNYSKRFKPLKKMFENDFNEAYYRLQLVEKGIKEIFGYTVPLPKFEERTDFFDNCFVWCREAINWLISFTRFDQSFVIPISLKSKIIKEKKSWEECLNKGSLTFIIDQQDFDNDFHVRVKGLSIFINAYPGSKKEKNKSENYLETYNGIIRAQIKPPEESFYVHNSSHTEGNIIQKLPVLKLNRISTRGFIRQPEISGTSIYENISPFGEWKIDFPQIKNESLNKLILINDFTMDLYVTVSRRNL